MNVWIKLGLPILLGAAAAGINWVVLQQELAPHEYVKVSQNVKAGELFTKDKLTKITLSKETGSGSLEGTAVKWQDSSMLYGLPSIRELRAGDVVLWRDAPAARKEVMLKPDERAMLISLEHIKYEPSLLMVGHQIGFVVDRDGPAATDPLAVGPNSKPLVMARRSYVVEGPFRIVSVGRRVSAYAEGDAADGTAARVITIAVKTIPGDSVEAMDDQTNRLLQALAPTQSRNGRVEALVLYPAKD